MKISIYTTVAIIVVLLFVASAVSLYFAFLNQYATPLTTIAVANIFAVILLIFLITRGVIVPLNQVREMMRRVGEGNLRARIKPLAMQEMKELGETLNEMTERLGKAKEELEAAQTSLVVRVQELERFQKLAIGRELKMVEFKEEIQKLREELNHKKI